MWIMSLYVKVRKLMYIFSIEMELKHDIYLFVLSYCFIFPNYK